MNEQLTPPMDDASILEELRVLGLDVTAANSQIEVLTATRDSKLERVRELYQLYSTRSLTVASAASEIIESNPAKPKIDRRREHNSIKNINIGVNLSFRHSKSQGYDAAQALERATKSIVDTAIGNGLHSKKCLCAGRTDNCGRTDALVTSARNLPDAVTKKLRQCFDKYGKESEAVVKAEELVMTA